MALWELSEADFQKGGLAQSERSLGTPRVRSASTARRPRAYRSQGAYRPAGAYGAGGAAPDTFSRAVGSFVGGAFGLPSFGR